MIKVFALIVILFILTSNVYGYIDPGTGSYVIQVLIAALVGASLGFKVYWKRIKTFLKKRFPGKNNKENENQGYE